MAGANFCNWSHATLHNYPDNNLGSTLVKKSKFTKNNNISVTPYCSDFLTSSETRQQKPCKATSERVVNRFDFPLDSVQVQSNSYIGVNTRLLNKQNIEKEDLI